MIVISSNKNKLVDTYILASEGISLISNLIKKYQRGFPYTHIAYVYKWNEKDNRLKNNPIVIEAWHLPVRKKFMEKRIKILGKKIITVKIPKIQFGGVFLRDFASSHTIGTKFSIFRVKTTLEQKEKIEEFLFDKVRKTELGLVEYDLKGFFGFITFSKNSDDKNAYFCSELVFSAYKYAGIELLKNIEPYKVSPRLLLLSPYLEKVYDGITQLS
jgi:hypothetical protein